jgi:hypothetical protein
MSLAEAHVGTRSIIAVSPSESERNLWDRCPNETAKAFHAFTLYRDAGFERSIRRLAESLHKSHQRMYQLSVRYNWRDRVRAWDDFQDQLSQIETIKQRVELGRTSLMLAHAMTTKAQQGMAALAVVTKNGMLGIKPRDLISLIEASFRVQNRLLGSADQDQVAKIEVYFGDAESVLPSEQE